MAHQPPDAFTTADEQAAWQAGHSDARGGYPMNPGDWPGRSAFAYGHGYGEGTKGQLAAALAAGTDQQRDDLKQHVQRLNRGQT